MNLINTEFGDAINSMRAPKSVCFWIPRQLRSMLECFISIYRQFQCRSPCTGTLKIEPINVNDFNIDSS